MIMLFISCLLVASGVIEFVHEERLSGFAALEIVLGGCGIAVALVAWFLTLLLWPSRSRGRFDSF